MRQVLLTLGMVGIGSLPAAADLPVDYLRDVKPILAQRCYSCHGANKQQSGLRVDTAAAILKGGQSGPAVVPGDVEASLLIEAVSGESDLRMPPEDAGERLTDAQVATLRRWILQGAKHPANEVPQPDPKSHWAFQVPKHPTPPTVKTANWARNPIDAFAAADHQRFGLAPSPTAPRHVLLRRVYLDLIGLPPTPAELAAFNGDAAQDAYEQVVDRLLASPMYAERWARHWMDIWRYSDWYGYGNEIRNSQYHIWRWRDWIIESIMADKGYDRMIVEMLAGDEFAPDDPQILRATGYLARNWYKFNRNVWLDATIEHTSKAFLGITMNCARCHEHKYDPIDQADYYRFRAFFEPYQVRIDRVPGQPDTAKDGLARVYDADLKVPTYIFRRGDEKHPDKSRSMTPEIPRILGGPKLTVEPVSLPAAAFYPGLLSFVQREALEGAAREVAAAQAELTKAATSFDAAQTNVTDKRLSQTAKKDFELAQKRLMWANAEQTAVLARIQADFARFAAPKPVNADELARLAAKSERLANVLAAELGVASSELKLDATRLSGDAAATKKAVADAEKALAEARVRLRAACNALGKADDAYTSLGPIHPERSTGRRTALARWIVAAENPLAARVAVNHVWLRHFGRPLVPTIFDFGMNGQPPTNQKLLDWLAVELVEHGWSLKHLHRLMVTSQTYRMQSTAAANDRNRDIDPDNLYLWRMNPRRMESEVVRDSVLYLASRLDLTMFGPELDHNLALTTFRRSLYYRHAAERQARFLALFDAPSVNECYRRSESIVPQQALAMSNSTLTISQARLIARDLSRQTVAMTADHEFIRDVFSLVLGREPTDAERRECLRFLDEHARLLADTKRLTAVGGKPSAVAPAADSGLRARENLVHVILNHNDFIAIR
jgi:mono/diheme cytochrome c family protein